MLLDIFVTVPLLLMTNIACYMRVGIVLICLIVLLAVAIGATSVLQDPRRPYRSITPTSAQTGARGLKDDG